MWLGENACRTALATPTSPWIIPQPGSMKSDERLNFGMTIVSNDLLRFPGQRKVAAQVMDGYP